MKSSLLCSMGVLIAGCAGDQSVTRSSPPQRPRSAEISARAEINRPQHHRGQYAADRIYLITRPGTSDQPRGEWRAQGNSIRESGSEIQFVELSSGKTVTFNAPHQITPTPSGADQATILQDRPEVPPAVGDRGATGQ